MFFLLFYSLSTFYYRAFLEHSCCLRFYPMQQNCNNAKLVQLVQQTHGRHTDGLSLTCHFDVINVIRLSFRESM